MKFAVGNQWQSPLSVGGSQPFPLFTFATTADHREARRNIISATPFRYSNLANFSYLGLATNLRKNQSTPFFNHAKARFKIRSSVSAWDLYVL